MVTLDLEVMDIRKIVGDGNLRAYADVKVSDSLVIRGFMVLKGKNGVFVSVPRKPSRDGKWFDQLTFLSDELKRELENKVLEAYEREIDGVEARPHGNRIASAWHARRRAGIPLFRRARV